MGERSPYRNPLARGAFIGLAMPMAGAEMARAVLEGVAFNLRLILDCLRAQVSGIDAMRFIGGGSRSALWRQILADVFALPIHVLALQGDATSGSPRSQPGKLSASMTGPLPPHAARSLAWSIPSQPMCRATMNCSSCSKQATPAWSPFSAAWKTSAARLVQTRYDKCYVVRVFMSMLSKSAVAKTHHVTRAT